TRFCDGCRKKVFYCPSVADARRHADRGHCVAIDSRVPRKKGDLADDAAPSNLMTLGIVLPPQRFHPGERVAIRAGTFAGREGVIERLRLSRLRATVCVTNGAGQPITLELDFEDIEPRR